MSEMFTDEEYEYLEKLKQRHYRERQEGIMNGKEFDPYAPLENPIGPEEQELRTSISEKMILHAMELGYAYYCGIVPNRMLKIGVNKADDMASFFRGKSYLDDLYDHKNIKELESLHFIDFTLGYYFTEKASEALVKYLKLLKEELKTNSPESSDQIEKAKDEEIIIE